MGLLRQVLGARQPALDVVAKGPLSNLALHLDVKSRAAGEMSGEVVLDLTARPRRIAGTIHTRDINVGAIVRQPARATAITGVTRFDLRLLEPRTGSRDVNVKDLGDDARPAVQEVDPPILDVQ